MKSLIFFGLLLCIPIFPKICDAQNCDRTRDSLALVAFYKATGGENWAVSWDLNQPMDTWDGVKLDPCVISINLSGNNLIGELPKELSQLSELRALTLDYNKLTGPFPSFLSKLPNLGVLRIGSNEFYGAIPPEIGDFDRLYTLNLSSNDFTDTLPTEITNLSLGFFWISNNQFEGPIPPEIIRMKNLYRVSFSGNKFSGPIPPNLFKLRNLNQVDLTLNRFEGPIPNPSFMEDLELLWLGGNFLEGEIPKEIAGLRKLQSLDLSSNFLEGEIPPGLGNLIELVHLALGGNYLTGEIPPELGALTKLQRLDLSRNDISGNIPEQLFDLTELRNLFLLINDLTGTLSPSIGKLRHIVNLDLGSNLFEGSLPSELATLPLERLILSDNRFSGPLPSWIADFGDLSIIDISDNDFTGRIPSKLLLNSNLTYVDLSSNELSGPLPDLLSDNSRVMHLWLHTNNLSGGVPSEYGTFKNLKTIELHNNQLSGTLPSSLDSLAGLVRFKICPGNEFYGHSPTFPLSANMNLDFSCLHNARARGSIFTVDDNCDSTGSLVQDVSVFHDGDSLLTKSDGHFDISLIPGEYQISAKPAFDALYELVCPDSGYYFVNPMDYNDTIDSLEFGFRVLDSCALLQVAIESPRQRWCSTNYISIEYENVGTDYLDSGWIDLTLPTYVHLLDGSEEYESITDTKYRFIIGDLEVGESASILLIDSIDCEAPFGATFCADVEIFPQNLCVSAYRIDDPAVDLAAYCERDSIVFSIQNISSEPTTVSYLLVRNSTIIDSVGFLMPAGDLYEHKRLADGATYILVLVDNDTIVSNDVWVGIEECGQGSEEAPRLGQFPTQGQFHKNRLCRLLRGSYDPNDKTADPPGTGPNHDILPNTDLRYTIRFQNTGNDTAFAVVIRDTIDTETLEFNSIERGASSHLYDLIVREGGILEFRFPSIVLPDSMTNLAGSQGFVSYTICQKENLADGTKINNRAGIYFDANPPIVTNTYMHTVQRLKNNLTSIHDEKYLNKRLIWPNPTSGEVNIKVASSIREIVVMSADGKLVMRASGVNKIDIPHRGIYFVHTFTSRQHFVEKVVVF